MILLKLIVQKQKHRKTVTCAMSVTPSSVQKMGGVTDAVTGKQLNTKKLNTKKVKFPNQGTGKNRTSLVVNYRGQ